METEQELN